MQEGAPTEEQVITRMEEAALRRAFLRLSKADRQLLDALHGLTGPVFTREAIAAQAGVEVSAVLARESVAMEHLRAMCMQEPDLRPEPAGVHGPGVMVPLRRRPRPGVPGQSAAGRRKAA